MSAEADELMEFRLNRLRIRIYKLWAVSLVAVSPLVLMSLSAPFELAVSLARKFGLLIESAEPFVLPLVLLPFVLSLICLILMIRTGLEIRRIKAGLL